MCQEGFQSRTAPLTKGHVSFLAERFPTSASLVKEMAAALQEGLNPHANTLALLTLMADHKRKGRYGLAGSLWGDAVRFPLSVVTPENGIRYRTPLLEEMHASVLSLNMSHGTMQRLDRALASQGMACRMMCSCGVVLMTQRLAAQFARDPHVLAMDRFRSSLDGLGRPVARVGSSQEVPSNNMDWTLDEREFHDELDLLIGDMAAHVPFDEAAFIRERGLDALATRMAANIEAARSFRKPSQAA